MSAERMARMCLAAVSEPGHPAIGQAVAEFGAEPVWEGLVDPTRHGPLSDRARSIVPSELVERTAAARQRFIIPGDPEWPPQLADLGRCPTVQSLTGEPLGLWLGGAGQLANMVAQSVAIVGSRACTSYGSHVAADLAADLADAGWTIVSGGAYGIDAAAHRGSLAGRADPVAVLAGGLDRPYPAGHHQLFEQIAQRGVLVSELAPGEHPTRVRFLARNRIIAALTSGAVMVEAARRSGARNTLTWAGALNRIVMAVPGPVTSATSVTPHRLIRDAEATLVSSATDVMDLVGPLRASPVMLASASRVTDALSAKELHLFEMVPSRGALSAGELALRASMGIAECLGLLNRLAEGGFIAQNREGSWLLAPRPKRASERSCSPDGDC